MPAGKTMRTRSDAGDDADVADVADKEDGAGWEDDGVECYIYLAFNTFNTKLAKRVIYHPLDQYGIRSTCHLCPTSPLSPLASLASESYVTDLFWSMRPLPGQKCE